MGSKVDVVVSVEEGRLGEFPQVVEAARRAGLEVAEAMATIGVISGSVDAGALAGLEAVPGVASVEKARTYEIGPPDSEVQ